MTDSNREPGSRTKQLLRARSVQFGMLPKAPRVPGLELASLYEPCDEVSGDFFDFFAVGPRKVVIVIGDVSGHGLDAAMIMMGVRKSLQLHARHAPSPREALVLACHDLADELPPNRFVSVFMGMLDVETGILRYSSAGHMPPLLVGRDKAKPRELSARGSVLGKLFAAGLENSLSDETLQLQAGDTILLYTDGANEAENRAMQQFTTERLAASLASRRELELLPALEGLRDEIRAFCGDVPRQDDLTMVALRLTTQPGKTRRATRITNMPASTDSFHGRGPELQRLRQAAVPGALLVVSGSSGLGKTRLVAEACTEPAHEFAGGVSFVPCAGLADEQSLAKAILEGLSVQPAGNAWKQLQTALPELGDCLLVLDDVSSRDAALPAMLAKVRAAAPRCCLVVTTVSLPMPDAIEIALAPLDVPASPPATLAEAAASDSLALLMDRARTASKDIHFDAGALKDAWRICAAVEGVPLGIELAAAGLLDRSLAQVASALARKDGVLALPASPVSGTSRLSLRDAVAATWQSLSARERDLLCAICQLPAPLLPDFAVGLDKPPEAGEPTALELLQSLTDRSLLRSGDSPAGSTLRPFMAVRQFIEREVASWPAEGRTRLRTKVARKVTDWARERERENRERLSFSARVEARSQAPNLVAAALMALRVGQPGWVDPLVACAAIDATPLDVTPMRSLLREALEQLDQGTRARAEALATLLLLYSIAPDSGQVREVLDELTAAHGPELRSLSVRGRICAVRALQDTVDTVQALNYLPDEQEPMSTGERWACHYARASLVRRRMGGDEGLQHYREALRIATELGAPVHEAASRAGIALCLNQQLRFREAVQEFDAAIAIAERLGADKLKFELRSSRTTALLYSGRAKEALDEGTACNEYFRKQGMTTKVRMLSLSHAHVLYVLGDVAAAEAVLEESIPACKPLVSPVYLLATTELLTLIRLQQGKSAEALEAAQENLERARLLQLPGSLQEARVNVAAAAHLAGEHALSRTMLAEARSVISSATEPALLFMILAVRARIARDSGEAAHAAELKREALKLAADRQIDLSNRALTALVLAQWLMAEPG